MKYNQPMCFILICFILSLFISGCQEEPIPHQSDPQQIVATFTKGTTFQAALRLVTDMGLLPIAPCRENTETTPTVGDQLPWKPQSQGDTFLIAHQLVLSPTVLTPRGWYSQIITIPSVQFTIKDPQFACSSYNSYIPTNTNATFLPSQQVGHYAIVTFLASLDAYETALAIIINLGLRLANPCYETNQSSSLDGAGQYPDYTNQHKLVIATTDRASTLWIQQLEDNGAVLNVQLISALDICSKP
jgi:hypothetical protein